MMGWYSKGMLISAYLSQIMPMNESSPYDTGNNKYISRVLKPATGGSSYYQVRFTKNVPGVFTDGGYAKQKVLFLGVFYFNKYKTEKGCLTAVRACRNREIKERLNTQAVQA